MKQQIDAIKKTLATEGFGDKIIGQLKDLREWFKANRNEPGYVKMIRLAYENIEENNDYTFIYLEEEDDNKYNKEELQDIKNLMLGIEPTEETEEVEETQE
jgi:heterodisulfide reductase subunit A-like polyferredoxin